MRGETPARGCSVGALAIERVRESRIGRITWLQVLGTAERSQIYQHVRHQLHAIVPLLDAFKPQQQPLERIFPRKGPLHAHPQCMDGFVEEAFASALGYLSVARIL